MSKARIDQGDTIIRNRCGSLPPAPRWNALAWTGAAMFVLGWGIGLLCGVAA